MKTLIQNILLIFFFVSCAHTQMGDYERLVASTENNKNDATAKDRLEVLVQELGKAKDVFPVLGNPRYYLLENFLNRTQKTFQGLVSQDPSSLNEQVFIPRNQKIVNGFLQIIASYDVMSKAGIYLNYDIVLEKDSDAVLKYMRRVNTLINFYRKELDDMIYSGSGLVKVEDKEAAISSEYLALVKYLASRIELYVDDFLTRSNERKEVYAFIKRFQKKRFVSTSDTKIFFKNIARSKTYKKYRGKLDNLRLPDSADIDGVEMAFEKVLSVQSSMNLIDFILSRDS